MDKTHKWSVQRPQSNWLLLATDTGYSCTQRKERLYSMHSCGHPFPEKREKKNALTPIKCGTQSPQLNQLPLSPKWCQALYSGHCTLYVDWSRWSPANWSRWSPIGAQWQLIQLWTLHSTFEGRVYTGSAFFFSLFSALSPLAVSRWGTCPASAAAAAIAQGKGKHVVLMHPYQFLLYTFYGKCTVLTFSYYVNSMGYSWLHFRRCWWDHACLSYCQLIPFTCFIYYASAAHVEKSVKSKLTCMIHGCVMLTLQIYWFLKIYMKPQKISALL